MERFNVGQLTKEMVVARLSELQDPCDAAAEVARKTIMIALQNAQTFEPEHKHSIIEICAGAMTGLVLREQNLPRGACCVLKKAYESAVLLNLDPTEVMELAIRGIVYVRKFTNSAQFREIENAVAAEFMGINEVFRKICEESEGRPSDHSALPES
ncbi:MAG: hypothetical protein ABIJ96_12925 [Elusimicrobiota bacterium]